MRRWFIALFTLHFCVSVGLFTVSHLCGDDVRGCADNVSVIHGDAPELVELLTQVNEADHGISDGHVDVPEFIHGTLTFALGQSVADHSTSPLHKRSAPIPERLQRPPRARLTA